MERDRPTPERAVVKALRSLERNQALVAKAEERVDRARDKVRSFLELNGLTTTRLGPYEVELIGDDLIVTALPPEGWEQFPLPLSDLREERASYRARADFKTREDGERRLAGVELEDILTAEQAELLWRADAGLLPCPSCGQPLNAVMVISDAYEGVVLFCMDVETCGFSEV